MHNESVYWVEGQTELLCPQVCHRNMNILPETFKTQLLEESTQTLEAMLVALHDTIISRKKVPVMEKKPVTKEDATGFVDYIEEFVSTEDDLISALTKEAMDFGLHNGIGKQL